MVEGGGRIPQVTAEGGLAVRPGGDQAVAGRAAGERDGRQEVPGGAPALVGDRQRAHPQPRAGSQQRGDGGEVTALEGVRETGRHLALVWRPVQRLARSGGTGRRRRRRRGRRGRPRLSLARQHRGHRGTRTQQQVTGFGVVTVEDFGHLGHRKVEHLAQQERGALVRGQALERGDEVDGQRPRGPFGRRCRVRLQPRPRIGADRLGHAESRPAARKQPPPPSVAHAELTSPSEIETPRAVESHRFTRPHTAGPAIAAMIEGPVAAAGTCLGYRGGGLAPVDVAAGRGPRHTW